MSKNKLVVAITGQSGSGKTTVSEYYAAKGYKVIDCDDIAKEIHKIEACKKALVNEFGEDIIQNDEVDRKLLANKAFESTESLQKLTNITHPFIIEDILNKINIEKNDKPIFVDGAVIIGHEFEKYCDKFIVVVANKKEQINRISKRDNVDVLQAQNRLYQQTPYSKLLEKADYVINNNSSIQKLIYQSEYVLKQIV